MPRLLSNGLKKASANAGLDEELWQHCLDALRGSPGLGVVGRVDECDVLVVDGNEVMLGQDRKSDATSHMDFVEGGNDLEAEWIRREYGKNKLLLDGRYSRVYHPFVLYHEAHERRLMAQGWTYEQAHESANKCERELRLRYRR